MYLEFYAYSIFHDNLQQTVTTPVILSKSHQNYRGTYCYLVNQVQAILFLDPPHANVGVHTLDTAHLLLVDISNMVNNGCPHGLHCLLMFILGCLCCQIIQVIDDALAPQGYITALLAFVYGINFPPRPKKQWKFHFIKWFMCHTVCNVQKTEC